MLGGSGHHQVLLAYFIQIKEITKAIEWIALILKHLLHHVLLATIETIGHNGSATAKCHEVSFGKSRNQESRQSAETHLHKQRCDSLWIGL